MINLESLFDILHCSPGIEEYATLEALQTIVTDEAAHYDAIIFDTAPTGQTLRVLALPAVSLQWIKKLTALRKRILNLRRSVAHIHGAQIFEMEGGQEQLAAAPADDQTMQELLGSRAETARTHALLTNPAMTSIMAVLNPEDMPLPETQRAADTLAQFGLPLTAIVINKVLRLREIPAEMARKLEKQEALLAQISQHGCDLPDDAQHGTDDYPLCRAIA